MFSLFGRKNVVKPDGTLGQPEGEVSPLVIHGREPLMRPGRMSRQDEAKIYHASPSIIDYLPWVEFLDEEECLLLEDGISVGAVYDVTPVATEGRTNDRLEQIRDTVEDALQDSFDEYDENPWVVQFFCQDEDDAEAYLDHLRGYVKPHAQRTAFTEAWLGEMARHIRSISRPQGLFTDALITGQPWRGQQRRTRMVIYRWIGKSASRDPMPPVAMLNQACERVVSALGGAGIRCTRQNGLQVHSWLLRLFNPSPDWVEKSTLYHQAAYADPRNFPAGVAPVSNDFAETLWFTPPVSDPENGVWWIDNKPHCALPVERLRTPPEPGTITGEQARGEKKSTR